MVVEHTAGRQCTLILGALTEEPADVEMATRPTPSKTAGAKTVWEKAARGQTAPGARVEEGRVDYGRRGCDGAYRARV